VVVVAVAAEEDFEVADEAVAATIITEEEAAVVVVSLHPTILIAGRRKEIALLPTIRRFEIPKSKCCSL
jgi:hypothetical protein